MVGLPPGADGVAHDDADGKCGEISSVTVKGDSNSLGLVGDLFLSWLQANYQP